MIRSEPVIEQLALRLDALPTDKPCSVLVVGAGTAALLAAQWVKLRTEQGHPSEVLVLDQDATCLDMAERFAEMHDLKLSIPTQTQRFRKTASLASNAGMSKPSPWLWVTYTSPRWFQPRRFDLAILDAGMRAHPLDALDWALLGTMPEAELLVCFWQYAPGDDDAGQWTRELAQHLCHRGDEVKVLYRGDPALVSVRTTPDMDTWVRQVRIEADLSRPDWALLANACRNRSVVELGSGGSTAMLARVASDLVSYETDQKWFLAVRQVLRDRGLCHVDLRKRGPTPDPEAPKADVYVVDCASPGQLRSKWLKHIHEHRLAPLVLVHDSRRDSPTNDLGWLFQWPANAVLQRVDFHPHNSNYLAISYRSGDPVRYVNWQSEPNRKQLAP
jgi:protein-L-isoaspartate O-methyltransferase